MSTLRTVRPIWFAMALKGPTMLAIPVLIGAFAILLSAYARRRGWIG